ncbi:MAG: SUMF1/EgtB/PvdO family nonheme iron enzyme [Myxococcales bacterium]
MNDQAPPSCPQTLSSARATLAVYLILTACSSPRSASLPAADCAAVSNTGRPRAEPPCEPPIQDLPPVASIRFNVNLPADPDDYPFTADVLPSDWPPPRSTIYLSAAGSFDPEGQAISTFWNALDEAGNYLPLEPEPAALRASFFVPYVGSYAITLAVVEADGDEQLTQSKLSLPVAPRPCAVDGFSPPCSDELAVPGGTFAMGSAAEIGFANEQPSHPAVIAPFMLDKYEVTVGRFRKFLAGFSGDGFPDGAGTHPLIPGSGWQSAWNGQDSLNFAMSVSECGGPWTDVPGTSEARPITCVTWYQAFAFCIGDGKRLPTESEWEFAAVGGDEQRPYPWGKTLPTPELAVYGCLFDGQVGCTDADLPVVGSVSAGAGRFGQLDLAGSVWEWTLDAYAPYSSGTCDNCANLAVADDDGRVFRGGNYLYDDQAQQSDLRGAARLGFDAKFPDPTRGFRCARTP